MAITFYYLSGSPFSWRTWLALEHKQLKYDLVVLSRDAGDFQTKAYLALNPHGQAPVIIDGDFVLYETNVICAYLKDKYSRDTPSLWPANWQVKARGRQILSEIDNYIYPHTRKLVEKLLMRPNARPDTQVIESACRRLSTELSIIAKTLSAPFVLGEEPSLADFALYPLMAILGRLQKRFPDNFSTELIPKPIKMWQVNIQRLPYFEKTIPLHW